MAKKQTALEKVLSSLDSRIEVLQRARQVIVDAIAEAPKRKTKAAKTTQAPLPRVVNG